MSSAVKLLVLLGAVWQLVSALKIDTQLVESKTTCFIRVALGEKLPPGDSTRRVDTPSVTKCERECSEDKDRCNSFSFGISAKGNGTCELSIRELSESETQISDTIADPDFDIYAKRTKCVDGDGDIQDPLVTERPRPDPLFEDNPGYNDRPSSHDGGYASGSSYSGSNRPPTNGNYGSASSESSNGYLNKPTQHDNSYGFSSSGSSGYNKPMNSAVSSSSSSGNNRPNGGSYGSPSNSQSSGGSYSGSNSNSQGSSSSYGSNESNDFNYHSNKPSSGSNFRPYDSISNSNDHYYNSNNQKPYKGWGSRPPGWSSVNYNRPYDGGNKPYGENGITYGGGINRPYESEISGSNYHSSISSHSSGSNSYSYGSSYNRPSIDDYYSNRPSSAYYGDIYGGYSQDTKYGDRFEWQKPQTQYERPYPTTYGDRFPYEKPGSYNNYKNIDYYYGNNYKNNDGQSSYEYGKPMYGSNDRPKTYGSGYDNYEATRYDKPYLGNFESNSYRNNGHKRHEIVAQIYGDKIAVSHGSGYNLNNKLDKTPFYRPSYYGNDQHYHTDRYGGNAQHYHVDGYRGNGYDNLMPNSPIYNSNNKGSGAYSSHHSQSSSSSSYEENHTRYGENNYYNKIPSQNEINKYDTQNNIKKPISDKNNDKTTQGYGNQDKKPGGSYEVTEKPSSSGYGDSSEDNMGRNPVRYGGSANNNYRPSGYDKDKPDPSNGSYSGSPNIENNKGNNGGSYNKAIINDRPDTTYGSQKGDRGRPSGYDNRPNGYGNKPNSYDDRPSGYDNRPSAYGDRPGGYGDRPNYGDNSYGYYGRYKGYNDRIDGYGQMLSDYDKNSGRYGEKPSSYGYNRPIGYNDRPDGEISHHGRPSGYDNGPTNFENRPNVYNERPDGNYGSSSGYGDRPNNYNDSPSAAGSSYDRRLSDYNQRPSGYDLSTGDNNKYGEPPNSNNQRPNGYNDRPDPSYGTSSSYGGNSNDYNKRPNGNERPDTYGENPNRYDTKPNGYGRPESYGVGGGEGYGGDKKQHETAGQNSEGGRPGYGTTTEIKPSLYACYRRVLAGKRVHDRVILGVVPCERLEDCQRTCAEERRFDCETFNYRLDPSNRGKGVCEMTSTPVSLLDLRKDFIEDRDYDFYELDRNSAADCSLTWPHYQLSGRGGPPAPWRPAGYGGGKFSEGRFSPGGSHDRRWDCSGCSGGRGSDRYPEPPYNKPSNAVGHYSGSDNNRESWKTWQSAHEDFHRTEYSDRGYGSDKRWDRHYVPYEIAGAHTNKPWGQYGGSYGHGSTHHSFEENHKDFGSSYNYWGLDNTHDSHYLPDSDRYPSRGVTHYHRGFEDDRKHDHDFNYSDLGHHKWESGGHRESYGGEFGYGSHGSGGYGAGSWHNLHGLTPKEGYGPNEDRNRPRYDDDEYYLGNNKNIECSSRSGSGFRFSHSVIRKALQVRDVNECERMCYSDPHIDCKSYSFRYTRGPTDNCFLSERQYRSLDLYNDVEPDRDSDVYAMNPDRRFCRSLEEQGPGGRPGYDNDLESDCFWRVRSGRRLTPEVTKAALEVRSLAECEEECLRFTTFTCRAFSYRHGSPVLGAPENCLLADAPASALPPASLAPAAPCALYERGSYGRGCEGDPFGLDTPLHRPSGPRGHGRGRKPDEMCYLQYDTSAKLLPSAVRDGARLGTEHACKLLCADRLRAGRGGGGDLTPRFKCMSFSYTSDPNLPPNKDNCLLSDIQLRDLQPDTDYTPAKTHWLFAYDTFDPDCEPVGPPGFGLIPSGGGSHPSYPGHAGPPSYGPGGPPPERPAPDYGRPAEEDHRGPPHGPRPPPSGPGGPTGPLRPPGHHGLEYGNRRQEPGDLGQDTWAYFTVSGWPCRKGSRCASNKLAGYWSCELEGGEVGSWDYCCHPKHRCGHSRGLEYPWCYVGSSREQWRPCSDQYYPYALSSPSAPHQGAPWDRPPAGQYDRPPGHNDRNDLPGYVRIPAVEKNHVKYHHNYGPASHGVDRPHWVPVRIPEEPDDSGFLDPPKPGGFGTPRYWPVSYLHKNGPPNSTYYKYDIENGRNDNSPKDFDRRPENPQANRRKDDRIDQKSITDLTEDTLKGEASTNSPLDDPRSGRDKENGKNTTDGSKVSDDGLVLISSSNMDKDPMDKKGRIVKNNTSEKEDTKGIDGKLENFSGETVEVFTVDEPVKITNKDAKANLERLLKEEKQIEEIGKTFGRRDDSRTSVVVEKRSDHDYGIRSRYQNGFDPVFVPVNLENKAENFDDEHKVNLGLPEDSYSDSFRNFSLRNHRRLFDSDENQKKIKSDNARPFYVQTQNGDKKITSYTRPEFDEKRHISSVIEADSSRRGTYRSSKSLKTNENDQNLTNRPTKSVVSNGQVFYEVSPEEIEEKKQLGRIEKVELKDYAVNVKIADDRKEDGKTFGDVEPISKTEINGNFQNKRLTVMPVRDAGHHISYRDDSRKLIREDNEVIDEIKSKSADKRPLHNARYFADALTEPTTQTFSKTSGTTQFGVRTGKVKKVELPRGLAGSRIVKRGRRNFRLSYNPNEVRKRLLDKQKLRESEELRA